MHNKEKDKVKYNIDKIIIPVQTVWPNDLKGYRDFNIAVLKEMVQSNHIPVELREFPTFDDVIIALKRRDIDVVPGIYSEKTDFSKTYTHFTGAIYLPNGKEYVPKESYIMAIRKGDTELLNFLNDMILKFRETGKLEQIQKKISRKPKLNLITVTA
ncbi:MAG: transporter substrate-binding domain-containing protein [Bacillales bacterium]|nr:transporter substrate-binding domain-containing protein [Bacillales bacterium]